LDWPRETVTAAMIANADAAAAVSILFQFI
jgi:hypothetical protein